MFKQMFNLEKKMFVTGKLESELDSGYPVISNIAWLSKFGSLHSLECDNKVESGILQNGHSPFSISTVKTKQTDLRSE